MRTAATRAEAVVQEPALYVAIETGARKWKVGFSSGVGQRPRIRTMETGDLRELREEIGRAKTRFGLAAAAPVHSCYEAGRDGFWLHRALEEMGVRNQVVESSSIQVDRRARRAKSDGLDVVGLVELVMRRCRGEERVCRVCRVPTVEEEDRRQLNRELEVAKQGRTRSINRIKSLLATQGIYLCGRGVPELSEVRRWDGAALPARLQARVHGELGLLEALNGQVAVLQAERREAVRSGQDVAAVITRDLQRLKGIGEESSWLLSAEFFAWRKFRSGKEVGALAGLTPTPYQSGTMQRELGISKAGNRRVRAMMIEIAWGWLYHQPGSALTRWYEERFGSGGGVQRRRGIVALARKLLVALWKYVEHGVVPEGAMLKG